MVLVINLNDSTELLIVRWQGEFEFMTNNCVDLVMNCNARLRPGVIRDIVMR